MAKTSAELQDLMRGLVRSWRARAVDCARCEPGDSADYSEGMSVGRLDAFTEAANDLENAMRQTQND